MLPRLGQATLTERIPNYPHALTERVPVAQQLVAHGIPMNVQTFYTNDTPKQVLDYYVEYFDTLHIPLLGDGDMIVKMAYPSVSAFDEDNGVQLHVICMPGDANGKTLVMLALADMRVFEQRAADRHWERWGGLPEYPNALQPSAVLSNDGEIKMTSVRFDTPDPADKVLAFYRKVLGDKGFTVRKPSPDGARTHRLDFFQSGQVWHLNVAPNAETKQTSVFATWSSRTEESP